MPNATTVPLTLEVNTSPRLTGVPALQLTVMLAGAGDQASAFNVTADAPVTPNKPRRTRERTAPDTGKLPKLLRRKFFIAGGDRKSTRLNSSHLGISYAVFCLKKK